MRRKSERTANKKKSPEKKVEKVKRTRRGRRKQSTSSENESGEDTSPVRESNVVAESDQKAPQTPVKEASPEESQESVWQVKTAEGSGDGGEIKKLKICLTRPPSTPERVDRSPRSKRKHTRATSSSDTPSNEGEERKKSRHRKKSTRESKEEVDKSCDSQGDEPEVEAPTNIPETIPDVKITQSTEHPKVLDSDDVPMSTTNEEVKTDVDKVEVKQKNDDASNVGTGKKKSDASASTTVVSTTVASPKEEKPKTEAATVTSPIKENQQQNEAVSDAKTTEKEEKEEASKEDSAGDNKQEEKESSQAEEVSMTENKTDNQVSEAAESNLNDSIDPSNETNVVESSDTVTKERKMSSDSNKDVGDDSHRRFRSKEVKRSDSIQSTDEPLRNGEAAPIVINRKRRWGSRTSKGTPQKSINISTDVLKEIIPDVKPVEFQEVIEERKPHRRIDISDRIIERPVLPKIVIDNTESVELLKKENEERDKENLNARDSLAVNRKISIVKDSDSIIARPPSPPRHKPSPILYITNLVRPFTLPQLKNLLQRTGRIAENGFWIDRIKSKCFVQYESEDQAVETRHALHGVTWPVSNPKTLQVDFSNEEAFEKAKLNEDADSAPVSAIPGTVEDWLREQDMKRERGDITEKPWERKNVTREWDVGKNDKDKDKDAPKDRFRREDRSLDKRRLHSTERSPEPAKKFKKKEEEAPAKLLDDLFKKTKTTPCIYWLPLSAETIAIKEEQRRQHMAEHERRLQELRRPHRRH